ATDIFYDKDTVTLTFQKEIIAGTKAALHIEFTGILNDKMTGFYRSSYVDESGNKRYLATTQFQATYARHAFPCWDEPAIKATFDITLIVPSELTALSNMNVISEKPLANGKKEVVFAKTPIMSTYVAVFKHTVKQKGLESKFIVDSCGTNVWREPPNPKSVEVCRKHNIDINHRSRKISKEDFDKFDYVLCMDDMNLLDAERLKPEASKLIVKFGEYDPQGEKVIRVLARLQDALRDS
ncbi:15807_t:CDS:2, partial [Entrophospora sp. SA101]